MDRANVKVFGLKIKVEFFSESVEQEAGCFHSGVFHHLMCCVGLKGGWGGIFC